MQDLEPTILGCIENITDSWPNLHVETKEALQYNAYDKFISYTPHEDKTVLEPYQFKANHKRAQVTLAQQLKSQADKNDAPSSQEGAGSDKDPEIQNDCHDSTKYDLRLKAKKSYKEFLPTSQTLQQWEAHIKFKFSKYKQDYYLDVIEKHQWKPQPWLPIITP